MRETVVNSWCDVCMSESEERVYSVHTYTVGVALGEIKPPLKLIELCEIHNKLMADLQLLLEQTGQTPELAPSAALVTHRPAGAPVGGKKGFDDTLDKNPPMDCPIPNCGQTLRKGSLPVHMWNRHLGGVNKRQPQPAKCPDCGVKAEQMMQHRSASHGYTQIQECIDAWNMSNT